MTQREIHANFEGPEAAQEALRKLQALRAIEISGLIDSGLLTATIEDSTVDRALHLIEQIGGTTETLE